ncbi:MAG: glycosyltransferase family 4 protein [Aulosira sp. ZfuVER01]|nr:glycosyltransferase family 4 protein [Aulosira sp. ZfuVER01]MDZ7997757.1 glycosyltransferase family 4 protein [Aulosira sp. DedVER01a]MDZ8052252.1 glycosyltransferase family 4 protein [Aulosira sp. ZfuCHP01]
MRILFVSSSSGSRGGGELYLIYLGQELAKRGHYVGLWCSQHPQMDELANTFGKFGEVLRLPYRNTYHRSLRCFSDVFSQSNAAYISQWQAFQPDILHFNKQNLEDGLDLLESSKHLLIPHLATIHITQTQASLGAALGNWRDLIAEKALKRFNGSLVAISKNRGQELTTFFSPSTTTLQKIVVIENGVRVPKESERLMKRKQARSQLALHSDELLVLAVGRMEAQKQPLLFLEWATNLKHFIPSARFLWVGDGRLAPVWDKWITENDAGEYIQRFPWQNDVTPFLAAADGFFHPAEFEGLPFALLEAMAWSLPCVITPSLADELNFNQEVCFVASEKGDFTGLKAFINPILRATVANASYQLVNQQFSLAKMVDTYEAFYEKLTHSKSSCFSH